MVSCPKLISICTLTNMNRGESGIGRWTLLVKDTKKNGNKGTFIDWHLKLWGESIDASKAVSLPLPSESDDADHDEIKTTSLSASTMSIPAVANPSSKPPMSNPSDHPERPTKPSAKPVSSSTQHEAGSSTGTAQEPAESPSSSWIDWLPSFGATKKAQIWIYGAIGFIAAFGIGLGVYLWIARRRRLRNDPRNTYEFEMLDEEEGEGLNKGEKGATGANKARRTRGGELYDAFAGGSDEEDDDDDDDDEFDAYRDRSAERLAGITEEDQYVVGEESDDEDAAEKHRSRRLGEGA